MYAEVYISPDGISPRYESIFKSAKEIATKEIFQSSHIGDDPIEAFVYKYGELGNIKVILAIPTHPDVTHTLMVISNGSIIVAMESDRQTIRVEHQQMQPKFHHYRYSMPITRISPSVGGFNAIPLPISEIDFVKKIGQ